MTALRFAFALTAVAGWLAAQAPEIVIPQDTAIFLSLGRSLNNKKVIEGDLVYGDVAVPVTLDDRVVIPVDSQLVGEVSLLDREAGRSGIGLSFKALILPNGQRFDLRGELDSEEDEDTSDEEVEPIPSQIDDIVEKGVDALFELFSGKEREIPQGSAVTIRLRRPLKLPAAVAGG